VKSLVSVNAADLDLGADREKCQVMITPVSLVFNERREERRAWRWILPRSRMWSMSPDPQITPVRAWMTLVNSVDKL
jgi:hypothetical protein